MIAEHSNHNTIVKEQMGTFDIYNREMPQFVFDPALYEKGWWEDLN